MGSSIYTRKGDKGQTSLVDGSRVSKDAARVEAYGTVDEANSWIGVARAHCDNPMLAGCLEFVQHRFYNCSSNLATPPGAEFTPPQVEPDDIAFLERAIDRFERDTGALTNFVVPGGGKTAGLLHVARTVCRRAERRMVSLSEKEAIDKNVLAFINRSSDFLFAAARFANVSDSHPDVFWNPKLPQPDLCRDEGDE